MDKDGDGQVDSSEILLLVDHEKNGELEPKVLKAAEALVKVLDDDKDGKVTMKEWKTAIGNIFEVREKVKNEKSGKAKKAASSKKSKAAAKKTPKKSTKKTAAKKTTTKKKPAAKKSAKGKASKK